MLMNPTNNTILEFYMLMNPNNNTLHVIYIVLYPPTPAKPS